MPVFALSKLFDAIGVKGCIIAALLLALGFVAWRADTFSHRLERQVQATANERAAHAVTLASLEQLKQSTAAFVAEGKRRTAAAERALERQESHSAALDAQIARIRAERPAAAAVERCESPKAVLAAEGL